ncbi:MAG: tRNA (N(6)-L-threonylcarbamoyladenosine(37)-C(2))-methylthiotransferase MtaB [Alphaproteobacteria bacterium]|jgi:threonylcarbamoyladenosine tRNA methylthiotransferase MtaB|nr:tRNA (N(6)-L-threonylcarbamoyladenosine(37)-C(2))-methylthiotransferase MtaB [Alphaproteobacteria bacterium]MDP6516101.1 tRNA (N(6)-L-threonylcarbamoyladenosine(37)-C(2))-methylthiotransferase MtaB [Alphaproteobacteria bacterium]
MTRSPSGPEIVTFGCRLNAYESEVMRREAQAAGLDDAVIVNTCAVTAEAERQARQAIRGARRRRPEARIVVAGCAAQTDPSRYAAMAEVDRVLGNAEKLIAESYAVDTARVLVDRIGARGAMAIEPAPDFAARARALVQVQGGCDHRCAFCIIPRARGPSRSIAVATVIDQVRARAREGFREVVLTGVDLTAYGADLPGRPTLGILIRRLLAAVPELPRLRLSSLDPAEIDEPLFRAIAEEERLMPHLHLSLQSGDDLILKRMKRRHGRADAIAFCARARRSRPDIAFGADLIAGFPTESEAMFANTLSLIEACDLSSLHVFPYSPRPGTPAARMPAVRPEVAKRRAGVLRTAGEAALARRLRSRIGKRASVLIETPGRGKTEHFADIQLAGDAGPGTIADAVVTGVTNDRALIGSVL